MLLWNFICVFIVSSNLFPSPIVFSCSSQLLAAGRSRKSEGHFPQGEEGEHWNTRERKPFGLGSDAVFSNYNLKDMQETVSAVTGSL